ncbi:MAG: hypothetical protein JWO72_469 [Caulobacteraceae bacterium]|jgi:hypothetical protein|nr:hypothetical protein [Caulobacteraceae bacterium]
MAGKQVLGAALAAMLLAACASAVTLSSRDGGPPGVGVSTGAMANHGLLKIALEGKQYTGEWIVSAEGKFVGYSKSATAKKFTQKNLAYATGIVAAGRSGDGDGRAYANAPDGATLRCHFNVNSLTSAAFGLCERNDGRVYDLTMRQ